MNRIRNWLSRGVSILFAIITAAGGTDAASEPVDLDVLAAAQESNQGMVLVREAQPIEAIARVKTLPKQGKTQYLLDTLRVQGFDPLPHVSYKMMLFSNDGVALMAYVEDGVAMRMQKALAVGDRFQLEGQYLWQSRHGPGLYIQEFHAQP